LKTFEKVSSEVGFKNSAVNMCAYISVGWCFWYYIRDFICRWFGDCNKK